MHAPRNAFRHHIALPLLVPPSDTLLCVVFPVVSPKQTVPTALTEDSLCLSAPFGSFAAVCSPSVFYISCIKSTNTISAAVVHSPVQHCRTRFATGVDN